MLLIADVPEWIFERHCLMLQRLLSDEFVITIKYQNEPFEETAFDLIYPLEWYMLEAHQIHDPAKYVTGIRSHLVWPDHDFAAFTEHLNTCFNSVHVVSRRLYDIFSSSIKRLSYTTHGVDTLHFSPTRRADLSGCQVKVGWAGNRKSLGNKGFDDIISLMKDISGVELVFCGYADRQLTLSEMREFYDSIDVYVCASTDFEGNNNSLMEAASMARAIVTTDNGTVNEYLEHKQSALIVERDPEAFKQAISYLRDNPGERARLGSNAQRIVRAEWDWTIKAEEYREFFRAALQNQ